MPKIKEIWAIDSETDPFKAGRIPAPFIWGAYNGSEYHQFARTDEIIEFLAERDCVVYAHNGGKFDYHFCLHHLTEFEPLMVISGRLAKFKIGNAEFRDSYNILPFPLSAYQKDEMDYSLMEPEVRDIPENREKIEKYLKSDCVYLWEVITQFIDRYGMHLTQAGAALKTWEKISGEKAPKTNQFFYETFQPFYYGGRVECFASGEIERDITVIDINSAYPFAMKHDHPYGTDYDIGTELPETREEIQRAFITLECISRGALPYREQNGLQFPNDEERRKYTITGWEYLAGIDTGTIDDVGIVEVITFYDTIRFDDYIDHFYELKDQSKQNDDKAGYIFAKLFLNSLYGKWGANPDKYSEYTIVRPAYISAAENEGYGYCAELDKWALCSKSLDDAKRRYYNVAVAASITGFVRAYMWRSICQCKGVVYCDTDSIFCESSGNLELHPTKLGAWDVEAECNYGAIAGKKLYAFKKKDGKWKTACKGVKFTPQEIIRVAKGENVVYHPENPSFSLKRGIKFISRNIKKSA